MLFLLLACTRPPSLPNERIENTLTLDGLHLEPAEVATVLNVRWSTAEPSRARVSATFADGEVIVEEDRESTEHAVQLLGLPPLTEVRVRVEDLSADGVAGADEAVITTAASPVWMPDLTWSADQPGSAEPGFTVVPFLLADSSGIAILDHRGRAVWAWPPFDGGLRGPTTRARLSLDGRAILFNGQARELRTFGTIRRVSIDGSSVTSTGVTEGHIDFVEYTPGGYASFGWDLREIDGRKLMGDRLIERAPDGTERVVWNAWDHFSPDLTRSYNRYYAPDPEVEDWSHINGLHYDAAEDAYYLTMSYQSTIVKIDRQSGDQLWSLSEEGAGDFSTSVRNDLLSLPHSVQPIDGGVLVFNRTAVQPSDVGCSFVNEIQLDEDTWEASSGWRYDGEECLLVPFLGSAQRLIAGNTLISWTTAGQLDEVTPDGASAWRVNTAFGAGVGFATRVTTLQSE